MAGVFKVFFFRFATINLFNRKTSTVTEQNHKVFSFNERRDDVCLPTFRNWRIGGLFI